MLLIKLMHIQGLTLKTIYFYYLPTKLKSQKEIYNVKTRSHQNLELLVVKDSIFCLHYFAPNQIVSSDPFSHMKIHLVYFCLPQKVATAFSLSIFQILFELFTPKDCCQSRETHEKKLFN